MWSYYVEGLEFVVVNVLGLIIIWVWDVVIKQWYEWVRLVDGEWVVWLVDEVMFFDGEYYVILGMKIYCLDDEIYIIDGELLWCECIWLYFVSLSMECVVYCGFEFVCIMGYGGNVMLEISNDGGYIWGLLLICLFGVIGQWM